jgi:hypothetical protein
VLTLAAGNGGQCLPWQQAMAYCADWPYFSWLCLPSYCRVLHVIVA